MAAVAGSAGGPAGGGLLGYVESLVAETVDLGPPADAAGPASPPPSPPRAELHLADLVSDAAGETVLLAGDGVDGFTLVTTGEAVTGRGTAVPHLTAGGEDVGGLSYVSFASGLTSTIRPGSTSRSPTCDLPRRLVHRSSTWTCHCRPCAAGRASRMASAPGTASLNPS